MIIKLSAPVLKKTKQKYAIQFFSIRKDTQKEAVGVGIKF